MESVETQVVETPEVELTELAKAMIGTEQETVPRETPEPPPEMETPEADPVITAPDVEDAPEMEAIAPKNVKELAEKLGISAKDVYESLEVNGKSLGTIKDEMQEYGTYATERDALDERRIAFDTESAAQQIALDDLATVMGSTVTPEAQAAYQRFTQDRNARETAQLLATTPEWRDPVQREADKAMMLEHVQKFGMSEQELNAIPSHKLVRIIREAAKSAQRVAKTPPKGQKPTRKPSKPRDDLKTIVSEAKSGVRTERQALGDVLRAQKG